MHNVGVASQIDRYNDAVEVPPGARWLFTSGTRVLPSAVNWMAVPEKVVTRLHRPL